MKFILNRRALFGAFSVLLITLCQFALAQKETDQRRGSKAIEALKKRGQYDSLIEAFNAARRKKTTPLAAETVVNLNRDLDPVSSSLADAWTQESFKVAADGAANDQFGYSVAISFDTAVIGAIQDDINTNTDQGSAYVFVRSGSTWSQQTKLTAADGTANDNFGTSVAISGNTIVIGAPIDAVGGNFNQGSAYVFVRSGTTWSQQAKLTAADGGIDDQFGTSVSVSGDTAIVGASLSDIGANDDQGSAYVFVRSGATWSQQAKLTAADGALEDSFGISVGINGDTAIVGAFLDDVNANADQGSAYVFVRNGMTWSQQQKLTAADGAADDLFGISVAVGVDTVIVGAPLDDVNTNADQGSAYVFVRSGMTWSQQAQFTANDGTADDLFGNNVAISGNNVILSSYNSGPNINQGSAYIFSRSSTTWTQKQKLTASGGAANDNFGNGVSISGNRVVVGVPFSDASASTPLAVGAAETENLFAPTAADQGAAVFFVNAPPPTAANVIVSGRIFTPNGKGLKNASVMLIDQNGNTRAVRTGSFGYYLFGEVAAGQTYTVSVRSKHYRFTSQTVMVNEDLNELNFIGN